VNDPAVSYTRFSDPSKQAHGDSQDRQDRAFLDFCSRFDLTPDRPSSEPFADEGRSGYLQHLELSGTQVRDAGLAHLKGLTNLRVLSLTETQVSDGGLAHLKGLTNLERLMLADTKVSDAGLVHLKGLKNLEKLYLFGSKVTDAGVADLKKALPTVHIGYFDR
jgi:hypothetical protein